MNKKLLGCAAGIAALTLLGAGAPAAHADPDPVTDYRTYAGAGSDTTQNVWNVLSNQNMIAGVASWDAFGTDTIKTKARPGITFARPAGSTEGVKALSAAWDPANSVYQGTSIPKQLDFARSSSGPDNATYPGTSLTFMPFARDAVTAVVKTVYTMEPYTASVTKADLTRIYSASTNCSQIPLNVGGTFYVNPKLPQAGSGTRAFFLKAIGVSTPGACVQEDQTWHENDGGVLTKTGDIIPFSSAQYIAQRNGYIVPGTVSDWTFHDVTIDGQTPSNLLHGWTYPGTLYCGAEGATSYGALDPVACPFARDVYNVIPQNYRGSTLEQLLNQGGSFTDVLRLNGFGPLSYTGVSRSYKTQGFRH